MNDNNIEHNIILEEESGFDLRKIGYAILKNWPLFLLIPLLSGFLGYMYIRYTNPEYKVQGTILLKNDDNTGVSQEAISEQLTGLGLGTSSEISDEVRILSSRTIMHQVIRNLNLDSKVIAEGRIKSNNLYGKSPIKVDSFTIDPKFIERTGMKSIEANVTIESPLKYTFRYKDVDHSGTFGKRLKIDSLINVKMDFEYAFKEDSEDKKFQVIFLTQEAALEQNSKLLDIAFKEGSKIIDLSITNQIPQKGIDIINEVIRRYNEAAVSDMNSMGSNTINFIDSRINSLTSELKDAEDDVQGYKEREGISVDAASNLGIIYQQVSKYNQEIDQLEIKRQILGYLDDYVNNPTNKYELVPATLDLGNQTLANLVLSLNKAIQDRDRLLKVVTADFPEISVLEESINSLRYNIKQNIKNAQRDIEIASKRLKTRNSSLESQIKKTPRRERELMNVKRMQYIKENLYLFLMEKREETAIALAATTPPARVVDPPQLTSLDPVHPKKFFILLGSIFMGLGLAIGATAIKEMLRDTIESEEEIRKAVNAPLIGHIGYSNKKGRIIVSERSRSAVAEMFRLLRTNLQFTTKGKDDQVILFTSSMSGEGKTFLCINLGMSFALSGKKVLMLGMDLRKPKLSKYLSSEAISVGMSNYLIGKAEFGDIIHQTAEHEDLHFIASGPIPPNPSELIMNGKLAELLAEAKEHYDIILIDSPPVGLVTDSMLIGTNADSSIFVVMQHFTRKAQLKLINQLHASNKLPNLNVLVNGVKMGGRYGYGYGYGYSYGYGYGYYEEDK